MPYPPDDVDSEFSAGRSRGRRDAELYPGRRFPSTVTPMHADGSTYWGTVASDTDAPTV